MKNFLKAIAAAVVLMAAVAFVPAMTEAAGVPTGLKQTGATQNSVTFTWDAVVNADTYYTSWSPDGITWSNPENAYGVTEYLMDLSAGKSYYVRVCTGEDGATWSDPETYSDWSAPLEVVTAPDDDLLKPVQVTSILDTSLSFSWTAVPGATSYKLMDTSYNTGLLYTEVTATSATVGGLTPGTWYTVNIYPVRTSPSGYQAYSGYEHTYTKTAGSAINQVTTTITTPATPTTSNFVVSSYNTKNQVYFRAADPSGKATGYEIEVRKVKGNKMYRTLSSGTSISGSIRVSKNVLYKYRARFYAQSGAQKLYSGWSGYRYFCMQSISGKTRTSLRNKYKTITMKWGKVDCASGYTVSVSTKAKDSGYKKLKSLGKKKKSLKITKVKKSKLRKGKVYYVKVVPKLKDGKKRVSSDIISYITSY